MSALITEALERWGFEGAECRFITGRENLVYQVSTPEQTYALRIKRPGLRNEAELHSELLWLDAMYEAGLSVPRPKPSLKGHLLEQVGDYRVDIVGWLSGQSLGNTRVSLDLPEAPAVFQKLGRTMAQLHDASDSFALPEQFSRWHWNTDGLLGADPLWGRFWENPTLDKPTRSLFIEFRESAKLCLNKHADSLDYGLIHADLVRENVLVDDGNLHLLDFDDGGFGFRLFDIATALLKNRQEESFEYLKASLISGYHEQRELDTSLLDLFMALRATTYVGWIVPRMNEQGSTERNARFITDAQDLCTAYLSEHAQ